MYLPKCVMEGGLFSVFILFDFSIFFLAFRIQAAIFCGGCHGQHLTENFLSLEEINALC